MNWYEKFIHSGRNDIPPPPELPKYDNKEEPAKWNWQRVRHNLPVERDQPWTEIGNHPDSPDKPDWRGVVQSKVIEYPMPEEYKFGNYKDKRYFWFDTPDYADPFKKLFHSLRFFAGTGYIYGCVVATYKGLKFTGANNLMLVKRFVVPWTSAGMAGALTVLCLANLRGKKDDIYNYIAAGFVMGSVLGRKNHVMWFKCTAILTPLAGIVKYNAEVNGILLPTWSRRFHRKSLTGLDGEHGMASGDLRFGLRINHPDPGRDTRTPY